VQLTLACKLHDPAAHCPLHELLVEPPVPNRPAAHSEHDDWPEFAWNRPDMHDSHSRFEVLDGATTALEPAAHVACSKQNVLSASL
jgi:hypothetical protein